MVKKNLFLLVALSTLLFAVVSCSDSGTDGSFQDFSSMDSTSSSGGSSNSEPVAITVDCGAGGTCVPGDTTVLQGAEIPFVFKANKEFYLDTLVLNDSLYFVSDTAKAYYGGYTFTYGNIQSALHFVVRFKKLPPASSSAVEASSQSVSPVSIKIDCGSGGSCSPSKDTTVAPGSNLNIVFKADADKMVSQVKLDGVERFTSDTTKTIYASFTSALENIHNPRDFVVRFKLRP